MTRCDKRAWNQMRPFTLQNDFLNHPLSSVLACCGRTKVCCAISFDTGVPGWMRAQKVSGGWVTGEYGMLPAATGERTQRESVKGKQSGRTMEIQRLIGRSLRAVVDLQATGANTFSIDCDVIDADGGTRTTSVSGAACALYIGFERLKNRGFLSVNPMRELVAAVSAGIVDGKVMLDLCYEEDSAADVDMNIVMTESGKFVEIQGTAEHDPFDEAQLSRILACAREGLQHIFAVQRAAIQAACAANACPPLNSVGDAFANLKL